MRLLCVEGESVFGDRMKKIFSEFFVLDFMRTEKFREDIV